MKVIEPANDRLATEADYWKYRIQLDLFRCDRFVIHEVHQMKKKFAVKINRRPFSENDPKSVIAFSPQFKEACDA